jgi:hypothetical protein
MNSGIVLLIFGLILFILNIFVAPLVRFKPYFDWWKSYPTSTNQNCFSITALAYYQTSILAYYSYALFQGVPAGFKDGWSAFIFNFMTLAKGISSEGFVLPKHICISIVPDTPPHSSLNSGLTSWPTSVEGTDGTDASKWGWRQLLQFWGANFTNNIWDPDRTKWVSNDDNFLFKVWGIPVDSALIYGFITNSATLNGQIIYPYAIHPLLGAAGAGAGAPGGWWGFLQEGGDFNNGGLDQINRIVYGSITPTKTNSSAPGVGCNISSAIGGGISGAMGGAGIGFMAGGPVGAAIGGIFGGLASGLASAASSGCL